MQYFEDIYRSNDKNEKLQLHPHYRDPRFANKSAQIVFGSREPNLKYVYDDRLQQWNYEKYKSSWKKAINSGKTKDSCAFLEIYLSAYFDKPIEIKCVLAGVNWSNGYEYWVAGYKIKEC